MSGSIDRELESEMSEPSTLTELYQEEMQDLWSANDQMVRAVTQLVGHVHDPKLKQMLEHSVDGIRTHTGTLKGLIEGAGGESRPDHCKGMEGLVAEALKHGIKEAPTVGALQDIEIIAQYQRMSHYGIAGFGSAAAYAKALGRPQDESALKTMVADIYKADQYASKLADHLEQAAA